jgi:hypothetical protein
MNAFVLDAILPVALVVCTLWNGLGIPLSLLGWFLIRKEIEWPARGFHLSASKLTWVRRCG